MTVSGWAISSELQHFQQTPFVMEIQSRIIHLFPCFIFPFIVLFQLHIKPVKNVFLRRSYSIWQNINKAFNTIDHGLRLTIDLWRRRNLYLTQMGKPCANFVSEFYQFVCFSIKCFHGTAFTSSCLINFLE